MYDHDEQPPSRYYWDAVGIKGSMVPDVRVSDLNHSIVAGEICAIVDEQEGGIVAYAIGGDHANRIIRGLQALDQQDQ